MTEEKQVQPCPENDGAHDWQMIEAVVPDGTRSKVWVCPCGAWRRVALIDKNEIPLTYNPLPLRFFVGP